MIGPHLARGFHFAFVHGHLTGRLYAGSDVQADGTVENDALRFCVLKGLAATLAVTRLGAYGQADLAFHIIETSRFGHILDLHTI